MLFQFPGKTFTSITIEELIVNISIEHEGDQAYQHPCHKSITTQLEEAYDKVIRRFPILPEEEFMKSVPRIKAVLLAVDGEVRSELGDLALLKPTGTGSSQPPSNFCWIESEYE